MQGHAVFASAVAILIAIFSTMFFIIFFSFFILSHLLLLIFLNILNSKQYYFYSAPLTPSHNNNNILFTYLNLISNFIYFGAKYLVLLNYTAVIRSIVTRVSRFVNEFHILKATFKFCTRLSTFVMTFPFFSLLL